MRGLVFLLLLIMAASPARADDRLVRIKAPETATDIRDSYFTDLLNLALAQTQSSDGGFQVQTGAPANQSRAIIELKEGRLDLVWTVPTAEREAELLPVRIPLEKGLLGLRVLLIRAADVQRFAGLRFVDELRVLVAGQGHDWNSTKVLRANGFEVATASAFDSLFTMLRKGEIDYFPRGLNEAWAELDQRPGSGLMVEPTILLRYPATSYFFTRRDDPALAGRLERGLRAALADGSFDRLLRDHPAHARLFAQANLPARKVFDLSNPLLPTETPLGQKDLWQIKGLTE